MKLLTPDEASALLKVTRRTVYKLIKGGELPAIRIGGLLRVSEDQLDDFIAQSRTTASINRRDSPLAPRA